MDDEEDYSPPPTPSPRPRLRRSPKRQALHDRTNSQANQVLLPTIRPVTDPNAKVYATSPFPSSAAQVFAAPRGRPLLAPGSEPHLAAGAQTNTTHATPAVTERQAKSPVINASPSHHLALSTHNGPRLVPPGAHSRHLSNPPGEVQEEEESLLRTLSSQGLDVERLAMVDVLSSNVNNDRPGVPALLAVPTPSSSHLFRGHGSQNQQPLYSSSPYTPHTSTGVGSTSSSGGGGQRSGLGAIASVASNLSFDSTPMSVGTAGSSGTVVKRRGFSGATPAGFYALFPPNPKPQTPDSRYSGRSRRSSSAPPRPVSEGNLSPISAGSNSPVSPVSSLDDEYEDDGSPAVSRRTFSRPSIHRHSRSEDLLSNLSNVQETRRYPILQLSSGSTALDPQRAGSGQFYLQSPTQSIQRKPVSRSNAMRWNSYMSTIPSESEGRSSVAPSSAIGETTRSSRALPEGDPGSTRRPSEPRQSSEPRRSSASIDFATLNAPFPMPAPLSVDKRASRQRSSSGGNTVRLVSDNFPKRQSSLLPPSSPPPRDARRLGSPRSIYSQEEPRDSYRSSGSQTEMSIPPAKRGSLMFFRESLPGWARYSHNFSTGQDDFRHSPPIYYPPEHTLLTPKPPPVPPKSPHVSFVSNELPDIITCPNCSVRWKPEPSPNKLNQSNLNKLAAVSAVAYATAAPKSARTNTGKRVYYADERKHRETIGRPLSKISDGSGGSRRHTIDSLTESFRRQNRRSRQDDLRQPTRGLRPNRPQRPNERDRPISMPITPATPHTPYDPSVFIGEEIRGPIRDKSGSNWAPHLWHNRQSAMKRRSVFLAPSIDEEAEGKGLTRRNVQIWFFAVGFVLPFRGSPFHTPIIMLANSLPKSGSSLACFLSRPNLALLLHHPPSNTILRRHSGRSTKHATRMLDGGETSIESCRLLGLASSLQL